MTDAQRGTHASRLASEPGKAVASAETSMDIDDSADADAVLMSLRLTPHRSLKPHHFKRLFQVLMAVCAVACLRFIAVGAWPVAAFVVLDLALVWLAFFVSFRSGRMAEVITLTERDLLVARLHPGGQVQHWRFEPTWAQIRCDGEDATLTLSSHGRHLTLGQFLSSDERRDIAREIKDRLFQWRGR